MRRFLRRHGLGTTLGTLFLVSWLCQAVSQYYEARIEPGPVDWQAFWGAFGTSTFENWQSEFLQLFTFVMLTKWLYEAGSHESKDLPEDS